MRVPASAAATVLRAHTAFVQQCLTCRMLLPHAVYWRTTLPCGACGAAAPHGAHLCLRRLRRPQRHLRRRTVLCV